ncbi:hypothetical protein ABIA32_000267 [Streptacidiphilus sp. MAP12-20]|uniref:hypothetical protein n=1 Tax=Streptacidiphilus sp. MAP12-20 TaxID=3156299 RepID=UPI0035176BFB
MEWSSFASTALGAVIGVTSTLVADRVRWRRDHLDKRQDRQRQLYADYLTALSRTGNEIREAARSSSLSAPERGRMAVEAFKSGGAYELRYQVSISAPDEVEQSSVAAFRALRNLRDLVESGTAHDEASYREARQHWDDTFSELRSHIRADLGGHPSAS